MSDGARDPYRLPILRGRYGLGGPVPIRGGKKNENENARETRNGVMQSDDRGKSSHTKALRLRLRNAYTVSRDTEGNG